jgi:hypothetical protein
MESNLINNNREMEKVGNNIKAKEKDSSDSYQKYKDCFEKGFNNQNLKLSICYLFLKEYRKNLNTNI